jgi:acetyl/propionyl-CoA carboxylase alpha subunit
MKIALNNRVVELTPSGSSYRVSLHDKSVEVQILHAEAGQLDLLIDRQRVRAYVSTDGLQRWVTVGGKTFVWTKASAGGRSRQPQHAAGELTAPMPGQIRAVNVQEGQQVNKGQTLMLLEAMKMEIRIQAGREGVVKSLKVKQGQTVERDQLLVEIAEAAGS